MTLLLLIRHGRTAANASGTLAGWTPGIELDERGREQAEALAKRVAGIPVKQVVSSPLERCRQTADIVFGDHADLDVSVDERLGECKYGDWTGRELKELMQEPMWKVVQAYPSAAVFPGDEGESLAQMSARAVAAVREWNARVGAEGIYAVCSHGDVIKAIVADALGMHLDAFQRITVDPCSVTVINYTELRPFVLRLNDTGGDLSAFAKPPETASDAAVGGGAGSEPESEAGTERGTEPADAPEPAGRG